MFNIIMEVVYSGLIFMGFVSIAYLVVRALR